MDSSSGAAITGGPLGTDIYRLGEFQLHWGGKEGQGSEHQINGERYSIMLEGMCRLSHLDIDLGLVDFDLSVQPKPLLPNSHQLRQSWADSGTIKIHVNQTKSMTLYRAPLIGGPQVA